MRVLAFPRTGLQLQSQTEHGQKESGTESIMKTRGNLDQHLRNDQSMIGYHGSRTLVFFKDL